MGGVALIIAGAILTSMFQLYLAGEYTGEGIVRSRWWWEIVLNLQILSLALMWFCYVDRISDNVGFKKNLMRLRLAFSLFFVLLPIWLALISASLNWFVVRPPLGTIDKVIIFTVVLWVLAVFTPRLLILRTKARKGEPFSFVALFRPPHWYSVVPTCLLIAFWVIGSVRGVTFKYQYIPFLLYTQSAFPFLEHGLGWGEKPPNGD